MLEGYSILRGAVDIFEYATRQTLLRHATRPGFVYRHQWQAHDIVLWDNRRTLHRALGDSDQSQSGYVERTTVLGAPLRYVVADA